MWSEAHGNESVRDPTLEGLNQRWADEFDPFRVGAFSLAYRGCRSLEDSLAPRPGYERPRLRREEGGEVARGDDEYARLGVEIRKVCDSGQSQM